MRPGSKIDFAKRLRRQMTEAERSLWHHLRNRALGCKFRRQHPIGLYVVDFVCLKHGLVIELDGGQHGETDDGRRTRHLQSRGYAVLRFWNNEVLQQQDAVLAAIFDALRPTDLTSTPAPRPGPRA